MKYKKILKNFNENNIFKREELEYFITGYTNNNISDEIMTFFIKAIYKKGLSLKNTSELTEIMMNSGEIVDLSSIPGIKVDKHSTGGVGDKTSIILAPIVSALGGVVAKMSGRGLGFTGGTLDKLESIKGYNVFLSDEEFKKNITKNGIALIGQTNDLVPADKKIYALRDETNLIDSFPLIASSIMSKKLATGADTILLDVKCGDAAFMKTQKDAEKLANLMIELGKQMKRDVRAEITSMDTPLGKQIGNRNEIIECIEFLKGNNTSSDLEEIIYSSAATMLIQGKIFKTRSEAITNIKEIIENGKAFEKFKIWISSQGGDLSDLLSESFWKPKYSLEIKSKYSGFFKINKAKEFGIVAMKIGAGREKKEDKIDFDAGITLNKKTGDIVKEGELLFTLYSSNKIDEKYKTELESAFEITNTKFKNKIILNKL